MSSTRVGGQPRVAQGLTSEQVAERLRRDGPNVLPVPPRTPPWRRLAAQMVHFFALLFWVAGLLAFIAGMPQLGVAIVVVVVLNGAGGVSASGDSGRDGHG